MIVDSLTRLLPGLFMMIVLWPYYALFYRIQIECPKPFYIAFFVTFFYTNNHMFRKTNLWIACWSAPLRTSWNTPCGCSWNGPWNALWNTPLISPFLKSYFNDFVKYSSKCALVVLYKVLLLAFLVLWKAPFTASLTEIKLIWSQQTYRLENFGAKNG